MFKTTLNVNNVTTKSLPNTRFKKKKQQTWKLSISIVFNYSKIVLTVDMINMLNHGLIDITQI